MKKWQTVIIKTQWSEVGKAIADFANEHKLGPGEILFTKLDPPMPAKYATTEVAIVYYA
jgi:hypothetical protein